MNTFQDKTMSDHFFDIIEVQKTLYNKFILLDKLFVDLKIKLMDFIIFTPSDSNTFIQTFNQYYNESHFEDFLKNFHEYIKINDKFNIYTDKHIDSDTLSLIKLSIEKNRPMIYLFKKGKRVTNLYQKIRNSIAHGNYYILKNRVVMWNISSNKNITFFINIKLSNLRFLHSKLISMIKL